MKFNYTNVKLSFFVIKNLKLQRLAVSGAELCDVASNTAY